MKILNAEQIREWDRYTIQQEAIASIDLMERAASSCVDWLGQHGFSDPESFRDPVTIFCGKGNNGGDGLAIARLLSQQHRHVNVYIMESGSAGTEDFQLNLERLHHPIRFIKSEKNFPSFGKNEIIIDALLGSGLDRPLEGITAKLADHISNSGCKIISIDLPSGLPVDQPAKGNAIKSDHILSFQTYKLSFLLPENAAFVGEVHILDIGLYGQFYKDLQTNYELIDKEIISAIYKPRNRFAHKGNFGHAFIIAGSYGKMGAAILSARACLRSGAGLTSLHIPKYGYAVMQNSSPEAMVMTDFNSSIITKIEADLSKFNSVGIGPGIGTAVETKKMLEEIFDSYKKPFVLDADALNLISSEKSLLNKIPAGSILTPHPKEFERLFGSSENTLARFQTAQQKAKELNLVIVLKGHHSFIATPGGKAWFNNTGNAGMAKGGSGDVLTGILTALVAQGYDTIEAAILGVYLHGLAGDLAAKKFSQEAILAGDIVESLGEGYLKIQEY